MAPPLATSRLFAYDYRLLILCALAPLIAAALLLGPRASGRRPRPVLALRRR
jgi:hypothetical protein